LDYRGHGKSGRVTGRYQARYHFADVEAFLRQKIEEPAVIFGHSMGGALALSAAQVMPEKVRAVIFGDASLDLEYHAQVMGGKGTVRHFAWKRSLAGRPVEELVPILAARGVPAGEAEEISQLDPAVMEYHAEGRQREFLEGIQSVDLAQIDCPVLLLQGNPALGGLLTDGEVVQAKQLMPQVTHVRFEHAGHDLGIWQGEPSPVVDVISHFLEAL
jgi:pimeloyl-ACP methyl ester carboxylesterase